MSFFVDANVIIYAASPDDSRHAGSLEVIEAVAARRAAGATSSAVIEEIWHLELSDRLPGLEGQARDAQTAFRPLLPIDDDVLDIAFGFELEGDRLPGANDRVHAATCLRYGIDTIVSADRGFDAVPQLHRVDPIDRDAFADLW